MGLVYEAKAKQMSPTMTEHFAKFKYSNAEKLNKRLGKGHFQTKFYLYEFRKRSIVFSLSNDG